VTAKKDKLVTKVSERRQAYTAAPVKTSRLIKTIEDLRKDNSELSARIKMLEERLIKVESALPVEKVNVMHRTSRKDTEKNKVTEYDKVTQILSMTGKTDPVLEQMWDNPQDAAYDKL
jgi:hypothetical protein